MSLTLTIPYPPDLSFLKLNTKRRKYASEGSRAKKRKQRVKRARNNK